LLFDFENNLIQVSFYTDGFRVGPAWQFKIGGGFLVGEVDHAGDLTGPDLVYSYPDFKTLLVGHFAKGVMISAKESQLTGIKFDRRSKIPNLVYDKLLLRKSKNIFTFDPSNKNPQIAQNPLQPDPYESKRIYVGKSTIPGAGSGVFARHPGKRGMLVGFYNGVRKTKLEARLTKDDRQSSYMIDNDWAIADQVLDVPPTMRC
jgi:histone-lysine N-methyltransferase SETD7